MLRNSRVVIHVRNFLREATTIHFHGISQKGTPWMDGVGMITQCPIRPGEEFSYDFIANPAGTHGYHGHYREHSLLGLYGLFIVHENIPFIPEILVTVSEWYHNIHKTYVSLSHENITWPPDIDSLKFSIDGTAISDTPFLGGLINGKGQQENFHGIFPKTNIILQPGMNHRFRIFMASHEFAFKISIDEHFLILDSVGGNSIEPLKFQSIIAFPGESLDFIVPAVNTPGLYWFRAQTIALRDGLNENENQILAIVRYENYEGEDNEPSTKTHICNKKNKCLVFNCPWKLYPSSHNSECISLDQVFNNINKSS